MMVRPFHVLVVLAGYSRLSFRPSCVWATHDGSVTSLWAVHGGPFTLLWAIHDGRFTLLWATHDGPFTPLWAVHDDPFISSWASHDPFTSWWAGWVRMVLISTGACMCAYLRAY